MHIYTYEYISVERSADRVTILYYTILYYTILYYTILYYTILYSIILYYTGPLAHAGMARRTLRRHAALASLAIWAAVKELNFLVNPSFPLKGSLKRDIDIGPSGWVAVRELNVSYHNRGTYSK